MDQDRRYTLRELASFSDTSAWRIHQIVHEELGMHKVCARWIPQILKADQKQRRVDAAIDFLQQVQQKPSNLLT